jgi:uncharacterized protein
MYIEQLNNKKFNALLYLPIPLGFLLLIVFNYVSTKDMDTEKMLHDIIEKLGVNTAFSCSFIFCLFIGVFLGEVCTSTKY